jgi:aminopeptidase N
VSHEHRVHERCACGSILSSSAVFGAADRAPSFVLMGTERVFERPRPFRIEHIALALDLDHKDRSLAGSAELTITRTDAVADELRLDAVGFEIAGVEQRRLGRGSAPSWRKCQVVYDDAVLRIPIARDVKRAAVRVRYRARPRRGMYFMAPDEHTPQRPRQIWTQCQDEDARHIFPCHDKPHIRQTMDIQVRVEPGWLVLSNGDLVSGERQRREGRFHYRMRQALPSYLFTIVAGEFAVIEDNVGSLPVSYLVTPGSEEDGERTFRNTPAMIRLFSKLTGVDYPWTKYAQVVVSDFIFGGMENTGATTLYEHVLLDRRAAIDVPSDDLIAHELAHQWFGDLVTCRDWSHAWLNEGFATYMEHVWRDHAHGRDDYLQGLYVDLRAYLAEAASRYQRPVVCDQYEAPIDIFDRHLYEKGALFLHVLRCELGDETFWAAVRLYLTRHAGGVVETRDLLRAMEDVSGQSLERLFEQTLERASHPSVEVTIEHADGALLVTAKQSIAKDETPWALSLELDIAAADGSSTRRELRRIERANHTFAIPLARRPGFVVIDPELRILGSLSIKAPADMLRKQLAEAPSARGRMLAAEALGKRDDPKSIEALGAALLDKRAFWGVRAAAAMALGNIATPKTFDHLTAALRTHHPRVRRAIAHALGHYRTEAAAKILTRVARRDASYLVAAAASRALGTTRRSEAFDALVQLIAQPSWADVVRSAAIEGLAELRDDRAIAVLRAQIGPSMPRRARQAALTALASVSSGRKTRELIEDLLEDPHPFVRTAAADALAELGDIKARGALVRRRDRELDGRVRRRIREVLRDLGQRGRRELRRLREELDAMQREHGALRARVAKLEDRHESDRLEGKRGARKGAGARGRRKTAASAS